MTLLIALSTLIGILLGLLGGGGSILTVPVLVYIADLPAKSAIVTSLIVVCITSSIAVINHAKNKRVCWKTGTTFGLAGMMGAFIGGRISAYIPDPILLVLFAIVMVSSATAMLKKQPSRPESLSQLKTLCPRNLPVAAILFDVPIIENSALLLVAGLSMAASASGMALLVTSLCSTQAQAHTVSTFLVLIFSSIGGSMVPRFMMPEWLQSVGYLTPNAWAIEAVYGILARGDSFAGIFMACAILIAVGAVGLAGAALVSHQSLRS